jgi:cellulose synthase/poly-beta-1,6-N-acetylglucosamine synthase-like glycosyltransferase
MSLKYEIIVVDDCSTDNTQKICNDLIKNSSIIRYIKTKQNSGLSNALNLGLAVSKGSYVLFTDDDCIPRLNWIENMCHALSNSYVVAGAILSTRNDFFTLCHNISEFYPFMPGRRSKKCNFIAGANMGFRRCILEKIGGFQKENEYASDMELLLRIRNSGYTLFFAEDAQITHVPQRTKYDEVFKYAARHASRTIILRNKYKALLKTPFILSSPFIMLMMTPLMACVITLKIYLSNFELLKLFWTSPVVFSLKFAWGLGAFSGLLKYKRENR